MSLSRPASDALLDYGSNVRDEHDADYWPSLLPRLREIAAGDTLREDDPEALHWHVSAVRAGRYYDVEIEEPTDAAPPWIIVDSWERPGLLEELRAIRFETDAEAAAFVLHNIWPWEEGTL